MEWAGTPCSGLLWGDAWPQEHTGSSSVAGWAGHRHRHRHRHTEKVRSALASTHKMLRLREGLSLSLEEDLRRRSMFLVSLEWGVVDPCAWCARTRRRKTHTLTREKGREEKGACVMCALSNRVHGTQDWGSEGDSPFFFLVAKIASLGCEVVWREGPVLTLCHPAGISHTWKRE